MATAPLIANLEAPGEDLARKTVFVKLHLGLLGNTRKVSSAQVEVDADKNSIHISKSLLDSPELEAVRRLDGEIRRYLYSICLPFEPGIHLLPIGLIEPADAKLNEFRAKREELVEVFLGAYPRLCQRRPGASALSTIRWITRPWRRSARSLPVPGSTSATACRISCGRSPSGCSSTSARTARRAGFSNAIPPVPAPNRSAWRSRSRRRP